MDSVGVYRNLNNNKYCDAIQFRVQATFAGAPQQRPSSMQWYKKQAGRTATSWIPAAPAVATPRGALLFERISCNGGHTPYTVLLLYS